uniref:Putative ribonuclease H-like domain-containing protein n=1 Tax=Tanacetum cinerariifolium TaxID=118510 RepID=A0A6L2N4S5_TANCI|nr:putative ribonuclease H-like domain-containing protein [Tanacetum cinerariifolium]
MSAKDKSGLRYGSQIHDGVLIYENEVFASVFNSRYSDVEDSHVNDRFINVEGMHAVPPPMTGNYMPPKFDFGIDESKFTYGPKQPTTSESNATTSDLDSCDSNSSVETLESVSKPVANEPKGISKPKVWSDAPIIEEYESDSDDEHVTIPSKEHEQPSFAFVNTVEHVKTPRQTVKDQTTCSQNPKPNKRDWNGFNDNPHQTLQGKGIVDSRCSRHMTGNKAYLVDYQDFNGGPVAFGGSKGQITGTGKIKIGKLDFEDVYFVKEVHHFNLISMSQMCDKKNKVLFSNTECLVLFHDFKLFDENQVLLRVPRQNNMYSFNLENIVPSGDLACLITKATVDESNKWHRRLGHVNFKNLNKLVKGNLVRDLPSKIFQNDHTCVACHKGKQHKASCKAKLVSSISQPLQILHMDLFGPTSVRSINHKTYFLVITDDFNRFSWVFFLRTKDETSGIIKDFIRQIENQLNQKVKTIRCDNERKNKTLIEAARTTLADSFLPNTFWAKAVSTACYVLNRVLVTKPQNKTPYELLTGKFAEKSDEGFLVWYSLSSKAFRPIITENKANKTTGPKEANHSAGTQDSFDAGNSKMETEHAQEYYVLPLWSSYTLTVKSPKPKNGDEKLHEDGISKTNEELVDKADQAFLEELKRLKRHKKEANVATEILRKTFAQSTEDLLLRAGAARASSTNFVNAASTQLNATSTSLNAASTPANQDVYRNKKDKRGVAVRNKERLVAQGHRQEERIDYDEVFTLVTMIEAIKIFLAFSSYMGFIVYQMDVKSVFLYGKIDEEVYVSQPPGFIDPKFPNKVYKVIKALYGLHQAPRAWYATLSIFLVQSGYKRGLIDKTLFIKNDKKDIMLVQVYVDDIIFASTKKSWCDEFEALMKSRLQMSSMGELTFFLGLKVKQKEDGIFRSQDKYVGEFLKKFYFLSVKTASTPIETKNPLVKDEEAADLDVHLYRFVIGSLMYLTSFRHDIMYAVCACSRFQFTPKTSHLQAVKRIFRKSTTREAEYVAAASCCGQVLWIQNQMLDYGFNFMNTKIYIDNESTICLVKNPLFHSKTKYIKIRHHFIRDAYEKKLIQVLKIHTDDNVADLLTKALEAKEILTLKARIKKLEKRCKPSISHHRAWLRSVAKLSKMKKLGQMESVSKQGRKSTKTRPKLDDGAGLDADSVEYMETEEAVDEGRTSNKTISTADMKEEKAKEKGVAFKEVEESDRPTRSVLTLKPHPTIDPKDKGKAIFEEPKPKKMTRSDFDAAQEKYTIDERAKLLAEYFERRKKQLAEERAAAIRNKPLTKSQLRRLMMTYLKHIGSFTHSQLNKRTFEEIQAQYIKEQEKVTNFMPVGSDEDERLIQKMNETAADVHKEKVPEEPDSTNSKKRKAGPRIKKMSKRQKTDADLKEEEHLNTFLKIASDEEEVVDYEVLEKRFPIVNWESKFYHFDRHRKRDSFKSILMNLEAMIEERRIFKSWFYHHTTNGHQFTMSNRVQELASPEANDFCKELASPKQTALGKDISNPLIVDSLLKTIWSSVHHVIAIKQWLFQSKRLLGNASSVKRIPSGDANPIRTFGDYSKPSHEGYMNTIELPIGNNMDFLKLVHSLDLDGENRERKRLCLFQFSLRDEANNWLERLQAGSITTWKDLTTHVPRTSDRHLIELKNQVQRLMEPHLVPTLPTQVNNITTSCEIYSGPYDAQYCMEDPEQAFVEYASLRTDEAGGMGIGTQQPEEPKPTLEDEFQNLLLNLPVLEVLAHALIYNAILDKYVESLKLGKNGSTFVQGEVSAKMEDPELFTLPCRLGIVKDVEVHIGKLKLLNDFYVIDIKKDPETPFIVGRGFLATANAVIDCRMAKIAVGEGITRSVFDVKVVNLGAQIPYYARKDFLDCHLPGEWEIARDAEINPFKDVIVFRRMVDFFRSHTHKP